MVDTKDQNNSIVYGMFENSVNTGVGGNTLHRVL